MPHASMICAFVSRKQNVIDNIDIKWKARHRSPTGKAKFYSKTIKP
jgi:hypothetical protein